MFGWKVIRLYCIDNLPMSGTSAHPRAIAGKVRKSREDQCCRRQLGPVEWGGQEVINQNKMRIWTVRSKGRLERMAIFYFVLFSMLIGIFLYGARRGRAELLEMESAEIFLSLLLLAPILIPLLVVTLKTLLTSKIPKKIAIDNNRDLVITYNKHKEDRISLDNLAYSHSVLDRSTISITFYKTFVGTRGQIVYHKLVQVIGMKWTRSSTKDQVKELINYLLQLEVERKESVNDNLSLFDKISS